MHMSPNFDRHPVHFKLYVKMVFFLNSFLVKSSEKAAQVANIGYLVLKNAKIEIFI